MSNSKAYSPEEDKRVIELTAQGRTAQEIGAVLGRTTESVKYRRRILGALRHGPRSDVPQAKAGDYSLREDYWRSKAAELEAKLRNVQNQKTKLDLLAEQMESLAPKSYTCSLVPPAKSRSRGEPQTAVLLLSDTHIGKIVPADQTNHIEEYNFQVFSRRLLRLEEAITSILTEHVNTEVPELVVVFLGDMIDGALEHSAEAAQRNTLLEQWHSGGHVLAQFLARLSGRLPLRVYGVVGNHPRWPGQKKMPTDNRNSNLDMLWYLYVRALTRGCRITWNLNWDPVAVFEVNGYRFMATHGDCLRGGDRILGIPNHALGRMVSAGAQISGFKQDPPIAYYVLGHHHKPVSLPHATGEVIMNGSFVGIDSYGVLSGYTPLRPSQTFFFVHPKYGRSGSFQIHLWPEPSPEFPAYTLPDIFAAR